MVGSFCNRPTHGARNDTEVASAENKFFLAAQVLSENMVAVFALLKTVPKPCPFRPLFVPVSCLGRPRCCSILLIGLLPSFVARRHRHRMVPLQFPPRCAGGIVSRNGFLGNAVFEGEKREKILDFLPGAQRGRCAQVRAVGSVHLRAGGVRAGHAPCLRGGGRTRDLPQHESRWREPGLVCDSL